MSKITEKELTAPQSNLQRNKLEHRNTVGLRLAIVRRHLKLSQKDMSASLNIPCKTYRSYETGSREITAFFIRQMSAVYNVDPTWIINGDRHLDIDPKLTNIYRIIHAIDERITQMEVTVTSDKLAYIITKVYLRYLKREHVTYDEIEDWINIAKV